MTLNTAFRWYSPISTCTTNLECLPSPIPEIWKKTQNVKMSVIWGDLGHHRSSAISAFDRAHTSSYSFFIETMRLSCTVFEILSASCRKSQIFLPNVYLPPPPLTPDGVTSMKFHHDLWRHKTGVSILRGYWDKRTDGHRAVAYTAYGVAVKNKCKIDTLLLQTTNRKWYV